MIDRITRKATDRARFILEVEMALFGWLFSRTPKPAHEPRKFEHIIRDAPAESWPRPPHDTPNSAEHREPIVALSDDGFDIDYKTETSPVRRRRVIFIFGNPGGLVTGIDLGIRRLRTYRVDRTRKVIRLSDGKEFEPESFFSTYPVTLASTLPSRHTETAAAWEIRKAMYCQLCLLMLVATADGPLSEASLDHIMTYVKRENRFATREGWVSTGDKRKVWPKVRSLIPSLNARRDHIDIYVGTLRENWDNSRRFAVLNDALSEMVSQRGDPSNAMQAVVATINRGG